MAVNVSDMQYIHLRQKYKYVISLQNLIFFSRNKYILLANLFPLK